MLTPLLHTAHHSISCRKLGVAFTDRLKARISGRTVANAVEQHNGTLVLFKVFLTVLAESRCSHRAVHTAQRSARRQNRPGAKAVHLNQSAHTGSALRKMKFPAGVRALEQSADPLEGLHSQVCWEKWFCYSSAERFLLAGPRWAR